MDDIYQELLGLRTKNITEYANKVIPNSKPVLGVKIPDLRIIAKRIAKEDYAAFLRECPDTYYEYQQLKAFVLGYAKDEIHTLLSYGDLLIPTIKDWSVCDSFCQSFKAARANREIVYEWLMKYKEKEDEFSQRVVAVMLMSHFLTEEYIDRVLSVMNELKYDAYYTKMGVAWCVATAYAKFPAKTMEFLKDTKLDDWTYCKAIQKMLESYRISKEDKERLRAMKQRV